MNRRKPLRRNRPLRARGGIKNTKPLARKTPLEGGTPLARKTAMKKGKPTQFNRLPDTHAEPWGRWKDTVVSIGVCAVCGRGPKAKDKAKRRRIRLDPHHILPARHIRKHVASLRRLQGKPVNEALLIRLLYDPRNGLPLCRTCHQGHEDRSAPVPRAVIPECAFEFAAEIGQRWRLDHIYVT